MGIPLQEIEITVRNDAPPVLRQQILPILEECGMGLRDIRTLVCRKCMVEENPNNWGENDFMRDEIKGILEKCPWYYVYDVVEGGYEKIVNRNKKEEYHKKVNELFSATGIGWKLNQGILEVRGDKGFEVLLKQCEVKLGNEGLKKSSNEIKEALRDISRRPDPDITGAISRGCGRTV